MNTEVRCIQRSIHMRSCHRSAHSSVEVCCARKAKWLRARRAELVGDVLKLMKVIGLQMNLQRGAIAHTTIQVE